MKATLSELAAVDYREVLRRRFTQWRELAGLTLATQPSKLPFGDIVPDGFASGRGEHTQLGAVP